MQAVGAGQLPSQTLPDFQQLLPVRRVVVAGECRPSECVRHVLALQQPRSVRAGPPATQRRRAGVPGLGAGPLRDVLPQTEKDVEHLNQPRSSHRPQLLREDH